MARPGQGLSRPRVRAEPEVQDTPAEVDAAFRTLRRVAVTYFIVFLAVVAAFPVLTMTLDWWTESRLLGDLSPAFLAAAVGLYVVFAVIGVAAATLSSSVEQRMLGGTGAEGPEQDPTDPDADPFGYGPEGWEDFGSVADEPPGRL
ncbi:hypothetical protein GCM10011401_03440 [Nesterenkonia cremea]|uniref:Uncharacterized protein n=1 Tax=Nesterenkonia cremea TaxID=1882340 RepID=A0A917ENF1_9MICC|nr:hypothetical protein GCM10011401_03440 [Nesterenkonia cremea]